MRWKFLMLARRQNLWTYTEVGESRSEKRFEPIRRSKTNSQLKKLENRKSKSPLAARNETHATLKHLKLNWNWTKSCSWPAAACPRSCWPTGGSVDSDANSDAGSDVAESVTPAEMVFCCFFGCLILGVFSFFSTIIRWVCCGQFEAVNDNKSLGQKQNQWRWSLLLRDWLSSNDSDDSDADLCSLIYLSIIFKFACLLLNSFVCLGSLWAALDYF